MWTEPPVFVALSEAGATLANHLAGRLAGRLAGSLSGGRFGAEVHGLAGRATGADIAFANTGDHLRWLFEDGRAVVAVASVGIVTRCLAPVLADKGSEPPVVCISEGGDAVVPVLGGHRGANELARELAEILGVRAAVTTAGDSRLGLALDDPPEGWSCTNRDAAKEVMAAALAGEAVAVADDAPQGVDRAWLAKAGLRLAPSEKPALRITDRAATDGVLALHPRTLVVGVGCERGTDRGALLALVRESLAGAGLAEGAVACLATIDLKEDEPAMRHAADALGVPLRLFGAAALESETHRVSAPSDTVFAAVGTHSVAEAAALAAAGREAQLAAPKRVDARATCAVARAETIVDVDAAGRPCGHLSVVGMGPGNAAWRAPEATGAIAAAEHVVGYKLYLDLLGGLVAGKHVHAYELGEERDRVAAALDLAAQGKRVALVSSGDAGIYAMAALVFELMEHGDGGAGRDDWQRLAVQVVPGISALQAAAARAGAPLGHDFCTISLSDLLTPWDVIERRLVAAAEGDFVIVLYNPVSRRRRRQLADAKRIIAVRRPPGTPVVVARNLGRDGESVAVTDLAALDAGAVDMLTVLIIGSSETRGFGRGDGTTAVYTPRGYGAKKRDADAA